MKNLNKKIIVAGAIFLTPAFAFADMEMGDSTMSNTSTENVSSVNSSVVLKGKIDGYKVILSWEKYSGSEEILGYKIIVTTQDGTQKTLSVGADKTNLENWDAKAGKNVYQLFVIGADSELAKSNEVVLNMGPNGGYDFGSQTQTQTQTGPKQTQGIELNDAITPDEMAKFLELKKSLEESIKYLRDNITADNLEEIKAKAENLKQDYLKKVEDLGLDQYKQMIEYRFQVFFQNNFGKKEEMKQMMNDKKEQLDQVKDDFKQKMDQSKDMFKDKKEEMKQMMNDKKDQMKETKAEMKDKMNVVKEQFQAKKQDLKAKYKDQFAKKLAGKLDNFSADKIKVVIAKVDSAIEKYNSNESLTAAQKEKFVAQLNAIKDLLQEKLDELENGINIDELLGN